MAPYRIVEPSWQICSGRNRTPGHRDGRDPAMARNFHEGFGEKPVALPSDRSTGLVFAGVAVIAAYLFRAHSTPAVLLLGLSAALAAVSFLAPARLHRLNVAWFKFGLLLNRIVSPVVMLAMFAIVIVPFGLAMQLRSDPLRKRRQPAAKSYWIERGEQASPSSMANQF
jgi:hypothetical protein